MSGPGRLANMPARRQVAHDVQRVGRGRARARGVEHALFDHEAGAVEALLARLEHEHDVTGEPVAALGEHPGRPDQHGRVQVVPARVHVPGIADRNGTSTSSATGSASMSPRSSTTSPLAAVGHGPAPEHGGHRRRRAAGADLERQAVESRQHLLLRAREVEPDLGLGVQPVPQVGEIGGEGPGVVEEIRGEGHAPFYPVPPCAASSSRPSAR